MKILKSIAYRITINGKRKTVHRRNPNYPIWHCFTTVRCEKCGESYEPCCEAKHICKKQNSYPEREVTEE